MAPLTPRNPFGPVDSDDDDAQVDGDASGPVRFQSRLSQAGIPWAREGLPPWHMWGTTERVVTASQGSAIPATGGAISQQLTKVSYKRPDTWQWLFFARIISAPVNGAGAYEASVDFDVTAGLGRASVQLTTFERFAWTWAGTLPDVAVWSVTARQPIRITGAGTVDHSVDRLVAQDIQVNARVGYAIVSGGVATVPLTIEVGSFFAPQTHIRPDWYAEGPLEVQFPGSENQGR